MSSTESSIMAKERIKGNSKGIKVVRDRYNDLNHLIGDLSIKLSEVSSSIDQEFLSAYRVHMVDVQEDLKTLKQQSAEHTYYHTTSEVANRNTHFLLILNIKVATAESALHDDSAVATLETEVNWFSDETSRLKSHSMSMRKDMHHILSRISALNEQRRFLNDQLKQVLKRSKVLEVEINGTTTVSSSDRRRSNGELLQGTLGFQSNGVDLDPESAEDYYGLSPKDQGVSGSKKDGLGLWKSNRIRRTQSNVDQMRNSQLLRQTIVKDSLIPSSTHKTFNNDRSLGSRKDPGSQLDLLLSIRSAEEAVLERELDLVFREILRKKPPKPKGLLRSTSTRNIADMEGDEEGIQQHCRRMGGVTGLGLDHFSDEDRMKAVQGFLMDPDCFERVIQVLAVTYASIGFKAAEDPT